MKHRQISSPRSALLKFHKLLFYGTATPTQLAYAIVYCEKPFLYLRNLGLQPSDFDRKGNCWCCTHIRQLGRIWRR
jgi:hypothetical protein